MVDRKQKPSAKKSKRESAPRRARVLTDTGEEMVRILKGRDVEVVGRGPHKLADGTFVAEIIATERVLADLPKDIGKIEIRPYRAISARPAQVSAENRYLKKNVVPRGVGIKK